jgi:hypothetical protein
VLKRQPQCQLDQPGILRPAYLSKRSSIGNVPIRVKELRVIEHIKSLGSKLKIRAFPHRNQFVDTQVDIGRAWAAADGTRRSPDLPQRRFDE